MNTDTRLRRDASAESKHPPVLCVDLDRFLVATDTLWELAILLVRAHLYNLFLLPFWFLHGRAHAQRELSRRVLLRPELLPYRSDVVDYLREQKRLGRRIVLATAADESIAWAVARHLQLFDDLLASDGLTELSGAAKAHALVSRFGRGGFAYLGDTSADLATYEEAGAALVIGQSGPRTPDVPIEKRFQPVGASLGDCLAELRIHHWTKNVLLFLPLLLAHRFAVQGFLRAGLAALLFGLAASSVYVLNDLIDIQSDRKHPWKAKRPMAAGRIPITSAIPLFAAALSSSLIVGWLALGWRFVVVVLIYCALSIAYSFRLKRIVLLDVFVLAGFYEIRLFAGGVVSNVPLSSWLLAFSGFFFLSLAMAKRYSELLQASELVETGNSGRNYELDDRFLLSMFGVGSAFASIVILWFFVQSRDALLAYPNPFPLLALCPLMLYWVCRVWLIAHRGKLHDDPLMLAARDPISYAVLACVLLAIAATYILK